MPVVHGTQVDRSRECHTVYQLTEEHKLVCLYGGRGTCISVVYVSFVFRLALPNILHFLISYFLFPHFLISHSHHPEFPYSIEFRRLYMYL